MTRHDEWTVAEGRAQADRLRPLGVIRRPASPRIVCPDPTAAQLKRLDRERRKGPHVRGMIYPNGTLMIEYRVYANQKPWSVMSVLPNGKVTYTARRNPYGSRGSNWDVQRGMRGAYVATRLREYHARLILSGRLSPEEAEERASRWTR